MLDTETRADIERTDRMVRIAARTMTYTVAALCLLYVAGLPCLIYGAGIYLLWKWQA
jgi:hypothetical protein